MLAQRQTGIRSFENDTVRKSAPPRYAHRGPPKTHKALETNNYVSVPAIRVPALAECCLMLSHSLGDSKNDGNYASRVS